MTLRKERGASAILIAASMLVIMGFAALAIDWGSASNERRQDQAAADSGALAAAQFAKPNSGCSGGACVTQAMTNGANEAITVARASLDDAGLADWSNSALCAAPPPGFTTSPVSDCVAFDSGLRRAWVRIPTISSPTFFSRILGFDSISVSADAIADAGFRNPGQVLPFLIPGVAASNDYGCLKTGPNPNWGPCADAPATGNFGSMDFFLYGNPEVGTAEQCGGSTNRLISNIARGVDHPLGIHPTGTGSGIHENDSCPIFSAEPNMANTQPGNGSALETGMLTGSSVLSVNGAYPGRIQDNSGFLVRRAGGGSPAVRIDDTPLWTYLKSGLSGPCSSVSDPTEMIACINWAKASTTEIFEDAIITSLRFGFTPEVYEANFGTPSTDYHIKGYRPVYIDTTYFKCNNSGCAAAHTAGVTDTGACSGPAIRITCGTPANKSDGLMAVTAYVLNPDILPDVAKVPSPGAEDQRLFNLSE